MTLAHLRKWFRTRNWLDNLDRVRDLGRRPPLALEPLEARWLPAPIQFFYVPLPEAPMRAAFNAIDTTGTPVGNDITTFVNVAATENGTVLYYDQWEDGYETNLGSPVQATTQVWGDGNPANGAWPGAPAGTDPAITAGQVIRLRNDVTVVPSRDPAVLKFDGGDVIGANRSVTVSRAQFPVAPGSVIASAVEVRDTRFYGTAYTAPVGSNTPNAGTMFSYTAFFVQAASDGTTVQIDNDANGTFEQTKVLRRGETLVSNVTNVRQGARVVADKPVQAQLVTGQVAGQYSSRSYTLFPDAQLTNNYFTPVGQVNATYPVGLYVYNPNPGPITVNYETRATSGVLAVSPGVTAIPSGGSARLLVPAGPGGTITGTRLFSAGGENFTAVGTNDTPGTTYDWGFSLQPVNSLSQIALVALGTGNSNNPPKPAPPSPPVANSSPVWVTPLSATTVYVDYDGNPATGSAPTPDPLGNLYDVSYTLARLQTQQVRDNSDNDNSGMRLYTVDGTLISTAWGEDASTAPTGAPGFDAGSTIPAVPVPEFFKLADFAPGGDRNNDGYFSSGDVVRYTLRIRHIGTTPISNALLTDALPPEVTYAPGTTTVDTGTGPVPIPDGGATPFPLDEAGFNIVNLTPGSTTLVSFDVTINAGLPVGTTETTNNGLLMFDIFRLPATNTIQLRGAVGDTVFHDRNGNGTQDAGEPGIPAVGLTLTWFGPNGAAGGGDDQTFTTTTDAAGRYRFVDLPSGNFSLTVNTATLPDAALPTADRDGIGSPNAVALALGAAQAVTDADFGYGGNGTIGDLVWYDVNGDGVRQAGAVTEPGVGGATVTLTYGGDDGDLATAADNITYTTTTNAAGNYGFSGLFGGDVSGANPNYRVVVTPPAGFTAQTFDATAPATDNTSTLQLPDGGTDTAQDFGYRGPAGQGVGDLVWEDLNGNGRQDAGEPGLDGVTVRLLDAAGTVLAVTTTAGGGLYSFPGLVASATFGNYRIQFDSSTSTTAYAFTVPASAAGTPATDSDADPATGLSGPVTVTSGSFAADVDAGLYVPVALGNTVWYDLNGDGVLDPGEPGIPNATVTVVWLGPDGRPGGGDDVPFPAATTDAAGGWTVTNLPPGSYSVTVTTLPPGLTPTFDLDGTVTPNTTLVSTTSGTDRTDVLFGYTGPGSIGDRVFLDANGNGTFDPGEGLTGVTVTLAGDLTGDGTDETLTATTGADGFYRFTNLRAGGTTYTVTVDTATLPGPVVNTADPDTAGTGDDTAAVVLANAAPSDQTADFGYRGPGSIGTRVFLDLDADGAYTPGEGLAGMTVTLGADVNGDGVPELFATTTDADGFYQFTGLPVYQADGSTPVNYTVTVVTAVPGAANTIDPDGGNDATWAGNLTDAATAADVDFGYTGTGAIGNRVWIDANGDGVQGPVSSEPGLPGVGLTLTWAGPNGTFGDADDATTATTTDAAGNYGFGNLPGGSFRIDVTAATVPGNTAPTFDLDGIVTANAAVATLAVGQTRTDVNFGYQGTATVGGTVWIDDDRDGTQAATEPGIPGATVTLVWAGPDGDPTTAADNVTFTATTAADGTYTFAGLPVSGAADSYSVTVTALPAAGFVPTYDLDSGTTSPDETTAVTVAPAQTRTDVNFGYDGTGSLAGVVFRDDNGNGTQDAGEPGLAGVVVTLTGVDGFGNPVLDPATGQPYSATTDAAGAFTFSTLVPGTYALTETQPAAYGDGADARGTLGGTVGNDTVTGIVVGPNAVGTGYTFAERGATLTGTVYFDADLSGDRQPGEPGLAGVTVTLTGADADGNPVTRTAATDATGTYTFANLAAGTYNLTETQPASYNDGPESLGTAGGQLIPPDLIAEIDLAAGATGSGYDFAEVGVPVSGTVFRDDDRDGTPQAGEPGVPGVTVELRDGNGVVVRTTTTAPDGSYSFTNVPPGQYTVVEQQPPAYGSSTANVIPVDLRAGSVAGADFGDTLGSLSGTVFADTNGNGTRDPGEAGIPGVTLTLAGTDLAGNAVTLTTTTDANGNYTFANVPAGTYSLTETQPVAYADGPDTPGTAGGTPAPTDTITGITIGAGAAAAVGYAFAEATSTISGVVYRDYNLNGTFTPTGANPDTGIAGITLTLTGTDAAGRAVNLTTTTAADGTYSFPGLGAGTYTLAETQPPLPTTLTNGFYDGADTPGPGGTSPAKNQLAVNLVTGQAAAGFNFGELPPADPFGFVYVDLNRNGVRDAGEPGVPNVAITLGGTAFAGTQFARPVTGADVPGGSLTVTTDATGRWEFNPIPPGTYSLTEAQPAGLADGPEQDGDPNGPAATVGNDTFANVVLAPFPVRGPFNFGEVQVAGQPGTLPPFDFFPPLPVDVSKRELLGSTPVGPPAPALPTAPNFAAFSPSAARPTTLAVVAEDAGGGWVRVFDFGAGAERFRFQPFGTFAGGVRVATADVTGDGIPDVIAVPGAGGGPVVRVFDGNSGVAVRNFLAFEPEFRGGLRVAVADLNGDFVPDVIVTPDAGGGPIVRAFDGATGAVLANFFALDDTFRGGLRIAAADVNRDGTGDLIVTAGVGGGPRVAGYDGRFLGTTQAKLFNDFFAFAPELRSGFWVTAADADGDGFADVVLGAGPGGGPRAVVYDGEALATGGGAQALASFFAGDVNSRSGARVAAADLDGDGRAEVLAAGGAGWPVTYVFDPLTGAVRDTFYAFPVNSLGGVSVG